MTEKDKRGITRVPVVDLSCPDEELVARTVVKASEDWGVFQVVNHGIPTELIQRLQKVGREFFELPEAEKKVVAREAGSVEGYGRRIELDIKKRKGIVDQIYLSTWPPSSVNYRYWPKSPPDYREVNEEYARHVKTLSEKIMEWLSEGLGLGREAIKEVNGCWYVMNINHYPPYPHSDSFNGLEPHTDINGLTLIITNEIPGLQVFKDDHWIEVEYIPSAIIVNIGDQIMMLSNGKYKNVLHKTTVDKEKTRMSWPVPVSPTYDMVVGPLPELTSEDDPPKFKPIAYKDYVHNKITFLKNKS
uniref:Flavonol synthase n=1 Tax=Matthiola incana TaxID=3724 RepID=A0A7I6P929_MATIN|nr:flavonol synthase [Matthiola incana]